MRLRFSMRFSNFFHPVAVFLRLVEHENKSQEHGADPSRRQRMADKPARGVQSFQALLDFVLVSRNLR